MSVSSLGLHSSSSMEECKTQPQQDTTGPPSYFPSPSVSVSPCTDFRVFKGTCPPHRGLGFIRNVGHTTLSVFFQHKVQNKAGSWSTGLLSVLHPHITSCPSEVFTIWAWDSQIWAAQTATLFPNTTYPNQLINSWLFIQFRRHLSGPHGSSYLLFLQDAVSLVRPCYCNRDSGNDKIQDSEEKDHPGTMGMMGTIPDLLEMGSHGRCWCFTHYLWNYRECQRGRCYPLSHHRSIIRRNMGITHFSFEHNTGLQKKIAPRHMGCRPR